MLNFGASKPRVRGGPGPPGPPPGSAPVVYLPTVPHDLLEMSSSPGTSVTSV